MPFHVLHVDDDRVNTLLFEQVCLQIDGLTVASAETGAEAEALAAEFPPHLLVIDLHLPDTDGYALLSRLRAAAGSNVTAVLCTAENRADVADAAASAGYQMIWPKPVVLADVRSALQQLSANGPADTP